MNPSRATLLVTSLVCGFNPRFSWITTTPGCFSFPFGLARCASMSPVFPGYVMSFTSNRGSSDETWSTKNIPSHVFLLSDTY